MQEATVWVSLWHARGPDTSSRTVLLPKAELPLNIFEPRYLAMVDHALSTHRLIGIIQPAAG